MSCRPASSASSRKDVPGDNRKMWLVKHKAMIAETTATDIDVEFLSFGLKITSILAYVIPVWTLTTL